MVGIPIMMLLAWRLSFRQTYNSVMELRQFRSTSLQYPDPDLTIAQLNEKLQLIKADDMGDHQSTDEQLMSAISQNTERYHVQLVEFPESHIYASNNYTVQTFRVRLSGRFSNLVRFIHSAEYDLHTCRIVSVGFTREVHRKQGEKLYADLLFQSVYKTNQ